ncbi:unnamed protein product [Allacma fusca]|uniref:Phorbol-ester/DAG-type domain-containing protein n=1 Tax=Allacma fusca TaxID=39272 RepID=A0A8J2LNK2_9HEXA|nr:unnamed protein product [Allacma fusca]
MFDGPKKSSPEPQDGKKNHPIQLPSLVFEKIQSNDNCIKNDHLKLKESVAGGAFNQHKSVRSSIHYHETSIKTELNSVYHLEVNSCVPPVVYSQSQKSKDAQKFNSIAPHVWYKINDVREPEMCKYCQKITELNKTAFKCQDCKASCHFECMEKVELPCVIPEHLYA